MLRTIECFASPRGPTRDGRDRGGGGESRGKARRARSIPCRPVCAEITIRARRRSASVQKSFRAPPAIGLTNRATKTARTARSAVPAIVFALAHLLLVSTHASNWPQFRGPNATGIAAENSRPPLEFGPEKNLRWKTALPSGASSPVVWDDRIFLTGFADGHLQILCLKGSDGQILWRREAKADGIEPTTVKFSTPAAPSCATDGEHVVSYFGSCGLICHDMDGHELWIKRMPVIQTMDGFGTGSSPIIHHGLVYLLRDETEGSGFVYAFDVKTGEQRWCTARSEFRISYGTPVVWDGCVVCIGDLRVKGYDLATGTERWVVRGLSAYPCTTPALGQDGNLYVSTWSSGSANEPNPDYDQLLAQYDTNKDGTLTAAELAHTWMKDFFEIMDDNKNGLLDREEWQDIQNYMRTGHNVVMCIRPGGHGDITDSHVCWKSERGASYVASPLAYNHRLFLVKDGGMATSYDSAGKLLYEKQRLGADGEYFASPVLAAGRIYLCSAKGTVTVVDAEAGQCKVLARNSIGESISATPAISDNSLYLRTASTLWAFEEPAAQP